MARVRLEGLPELYAALRRLPEALTEEAEQIISETGVTAERELKSAYPEGGLRDGVGLVMTRSKFGAIAELKSRSPLSHLWEFGTETRHTDKGWNRGKGPAHRDRGFVTIVDTNRRQMNRELLALVRSVGFVITGEVA